jgi:hypothetical protein
LGIQARFFYPFTESAEHFRAVNPSAAVKAIKALQQLGFQFFKGLGCWGPAGGLVFLEAAKAGADNLTGGLIQTAFDFSFHKCRQFWR